MWTALPLEEFRGTEGVYSLIRVTGSAPGRAEWAVPPSPGPVLARRTRVLRTGVPMHTDPPTAPEIPDAVRLVKDLTEQLTLLVKRLEQFEALVRERGGCGSAPVADSLPRPAPPLPPDIVHGEQYLTIREAADVYFQGK